MKPMRSLTIFFSSCCLALMLTIVSLTPLHSALATPDAAVKSAPVVSTGTVTVAKPEVKLETKPVPKPATKSATKPEGKPEVKPVIVNPATAVSAPAPTVKPATLTPAPVSTTAPATQPTADPTMPPEVPTTPEEMKDQASTVLLSAKAQQWFAFSSGCIWLLMALFKWGRKSLKFMQAIPKRVMWIIVPGLSFAALLLAHFQGDLSWAGAIFVSTSGPGVAYLNDFVKRGIMGREPTTTIRGGVTISPTWTEDLTPDERPPRAPA